MWLTLLVTNYIGVKPKTKFGGAGERRPAIVS